MFTMIVSVIVGIFLCVSGFITMKGNLSLLHSYHYKRVKEEDKKAFGKPVGIGIIVMGLTVAAYGVILYLSEKTSNSALTTISYVTLGVGFAIGLPLCFVPMVKYNKGIF